MKDLSYQDVEDLKEMHQAAATIDRLARNLQDRVEEEMEDPQLEGWRTGEHEENRGLVDFRREIMRIHCRQGGFSETHRHEKSRGC